MAKLHDFICEWPLDVTSKIKKHKRTSHIVVQ